MDEEHLKSSVLVVIVNVTNYRVLNLEPRKKFEPRETPAGHLEFLNKKTAQCSTVLGVPKNRQTWPAAAAAAELRQQQAGHLNFFMPSEQLYRNK